MSQSKNGYALLIALLLGVALMVWLVVTQANVLFPTIKNKNTATSTENQLKIRATEVQQQAEDYKKQTEENLK
jgi:hypothetical protein